VIDAIITPEHDAEALRLAYESVARRKLNLFRTRLLRIGAQ
jgi:hypothetical protein